MIAYEPEGGGCPDTAAPGQVIEASLDEAGFFTLRMDLAGTDTGSVLLDIGQDAPEVVHPLGEGRFEARLHLPERDVVPVLTVTTKDGRHDRALRPHGCLGPLAANRPSPALVSRCPDAVAALREGPGAVVLFLAMATEGSGWDRLCALAAGLRGEGHSPWLLLVSDAGSFADATARMLAHFDLAMLAVPTRGQPASEWEPFPGDPALEQVMQRIAKPAEGVRLPALLLGETPQLLLRFGKPALAFPRACLLSAEAVTAPRLVYIPQHRQKLVGQMRDRLRGIRVILSSEPLRASLSRICPEVPSVVLRDGAPAAGLARGLGLPMTGPSTEALDRALRHFVLEARLADPEGEGRTGLLLDGTEVNEWTGELSRLARGRLYALGGATGSGVQPPVKPLARAMRDGVARLLVPAVGAEGEALAAIVEEWGLEAIPLLPGPSTGDRRALTALRGIRAGGIALLADAAVYRPSPSEEDLVLLAGGEPGLEADVVELGWAGDPRRGRLASLFDARAPAFWGRPPSRGAGATIGYGEAWLAPLLSPELSQGARTPAASSRLLPLLAFVLHAGCVSLRLAIAPAEAAALAPALRRLEAEGIRIIARDRRRAA
ncbi:hypothetical protein MVG78_14765 [Roseomonas gilardii subsp. gilardii]|uniref:hypothetical protein n=1 Tax=Roseomonas gilardii TaxID=257708 RepID=UPI001FFB24E5|nr:hypothetical protein [Roseomonas gilardii]UPG71794.1 hypothetical protein MVG78_14765 [Roseomonas gilardii subsp. gilardii]